MTVNINQIIDSGLLAEMLDGHFISRHEHDNGDLVGYAYTSKAQYEQEWNVATLNCRGLITDTNGSIVARPFAKFFNYGEQPEQDQQYADKPFTLYDKVDGSLGIHYRWNDQDSVATRGSFHSEQAEWATAHIRAEGPSWYRSGATSLYEIVYPGNRVIVDYKGLEGLIFLSAIDNSSGETVKHGSPAGVQRSDIHTVKKDHEALDDGDHEGFVAVFDDGRRVKIKLDRYVLLHRTLTGLSNRVIWEALSTGQGVADIVSKTPDEIHDWIRSTEAALTNGFNQIKADAESQFDEVVAAHGSSDRALFAHTAKLTRNPALLFSLLDGKPMDAKIWKMLRPETIEEPTYWSGEPTA